MVDELLTVYGQWWDICRALMMNEDTDIAKGGPYWLGYLKEQKATGSVPEMIIPGVKTDGFHER